MKSGFKFMTVLVAMLLIGAGLIDLGLSSMGFLAIVGIVVILVSLAGAIIDFIISNSSTPFVVYLVVLSALSLFFGIRSGLNFLVMFSCFIALGLLSALFYQIKKADSTRKVK